MTGDLETRIRITVETEVDDATALEYYRLYRDTFGELETLAVARQLLHEHEFVEEMSDPRVLKYVAWDEAGRAIGMSTLTKHLETVPWISPAYFAFHYPEHTARAAVFYLGFTLVHRDYRQSQVFQLITQRMMEIVIAERGVCGYDICSYNNRSIDFGANIERLLHRNADVTVERIDAQTYYAVSIRGPRIQP
jgi:hypothetical protein